MMATRLLAKRTESGDWVLEDLPRGGKPRTSLTPKTLGRIKKMRKRTVRSIEGVTSESPAGKISKSSAFRGRREINHTFFP